MARKRGEKSDATRTSPTSAIVVRQQTKQGRWLRLRATLTSYSTSSGRLLLCLNHVLGFEPTNQSHGTSTPISPVAGYTSRARHRVAFSESLSSLQTTHCEQLLLPIRAESPTTTDRHSAEDTPDMKMTLSRCWVATDVQLARAGRLDSVTDWQTYLNGKRSRSCADEEWSGQCCQRQAPDAFISYEDINSRNELQPLLSCDLSYITTHFAHSIDQSTYVNLVDRNIAYEH